MLCHVGYARNCSGQNGNLVPFPSTLPNAPHRLALQQESEEAMNDTMSHTQNVIYTTLAAWPIRNHCSCHRRCAPFRP